MRSKTLIRRAAVAIAAAAMASVALAGPAAATIDTDLVRLTDTEVDFGDNTFIAGVPIGSGSVQWDIVSGFYTPRLVGELHLNNASGKYGRMHISYWDGGGGHIGTGHSITRHVTDNQHHHWSVNLLPSPLRQITEVHVCTEISSDGVNFTQVDCTTKYLY